MGPLYLASDTVFEDPAHSASLYALATLPYLVATLLARAAGDRATARFGPAAMVRAGALVGFAGLLVVVLAPTWQVAVGGFFIVGLGMAVVAPLSFSAAARLADTGATRPHGNDASTRSSRASTSSTTPAPSSGRSSPARSAPATCGSGMPCRWSSSWSSSARAGLHGEGAVSIVSDRLDAPTVIATIDQLGGRIRARFADRGLPKAAAELRSAATEVTELGVHLRGRLRVLRWTARAASVLVALGMALVLVVAARDADLSGSVRSVDWVALVESTIQTLVFGGLTLLFPQCPPRPTGKAPPAATPASPPVPRARHRHAPTDQDPERLRSDFEPTDATVAVDLTRAEMQHYLGYCSELLALVGKVAALCAEDSQDGLILETVSDIENLTNGMSRKIWQKISSCPTDIAPDVGVVPACRGCSGRELAGATEAIVSGARPRGGHPAYHPGYAARPLPIGRGPRGGSGRGDQASSSTCCLAAPPAGSKPAASASSAVLNQNSATVASYHCEPSTWYLPESPLPLTV